MLAFGKICASRGRNRPWTRRRCRPIPRRRRCRRSPPRELSRLSPRRPAMFDPAVCLWLVPLLPLAASVLIVFFGPKFLRQHSHWPCLLATAASCAVSFVIFLQVNKLTPVETGDAAQSWAQAPAL